jgi:branched-chain amino acid transport system ATP-binding protein
MTVRENLAVGAGSISSARLQQRLDVVLNYFPLLAKRMQQSAGTLSGGEARVLAIAKKLMPMETDSGGHPTLPYLLILDEASSGLSPVFIHTLFETMRTISRDSGVAILLVEEGLSRLSSWVQRAYVLERRRLIAEGSVSDLEQNKDVASAFGGAL